MEIYNSVFLNNTAKEGGIFFVAENTDALIKIDSCFFELNSGESNIFTLNHGYMNLSNIIFQNNKNNLFSLTQSTLTLFNVSIMQHTCHYEYPGCLINAQTNSSIVMNFNAVFGVFSFTEGNIYLSESELHIFNSSFRNISTRTSSAAFLKGDAAIVYIDSSQFTNFSSNCILLENSNVSIFKTYFKAIFNGFLSTYSYGTISCESCLKFELERGYFEGQTHVTEGAAIYLSNPKTTTFSSDFFFRDTIFTNNTAYANGGAISLNYANLSILNCSFVDNRASNGGAIYFSSSTIYTYLLLTSNSFISNLASKDGGAIKWTYCEPYLFGFNKFLSNAAVYGNDIASFPIRVELKILDENGTNVFDSMSSKFPIFENLASGNNINYTLILKFVDLYHNPVLTVDTTK